MRTLLAGIVLVAAALTPSLAAADGCYICRGASGTYVKWKGDDTWAKRRKAEACGCKVDGTSSSCAAANHKILCTVALLPVPSNQFPAAAH